MNLHKTLALTTSMSVIILSVLLINDAHWSIDYFGYVYIIALTFVYSFFQLSKSRIVRYERKPRAMFLIVCVSICALMAVILFSREIERTLLVVLSSVIYILGIDEILLGYGGVFCLLCMLCMYAFDGAPFLDFGVYSFLFLISYYIISLTSRQHAGFISKNEKNETI